MARVLSQPRSLAEQRRELSRERAILARIVPLETAVAIGCAIVAGIQWWAQRPAASWLTAAGICALFAGGHAWKIREDRRQAERVRLGASGETRVAAILQDHLDDRYVVFNDVVIASGRERAQVDHLVLGPTGVIVLETKNWAGTLSGQAASATWTLATPDGRTIRLSNPILQNQFHCQVIRHRLEAAGLGAVPIQSWIVFASPNVSVQVGPPSPGVELLKLSELSARCAAVQVQPSVIEAPQLERLISCFRDAASAPSH